MFFVTKNKLKVKKRYYIRVNQKLNDMKILKVLLILIVLAVVGFFIAAAVLPTEYEVTRSVVINADARIVADHVKSLKNMQAWSPWADYDTNMVVTYDGIDGAVGSSSSWKGNEDVGAGKQVVTSITPERIELDLTFIEPYADSCDVYFNFNDAEGGVEVTWGIKGVMPFPMNAMGLFMNMDDMMGPDFEKGLNDLKEKAEAIAAASNGFYIETVEVPETTLLTERKRISMSDMDSFFATTYPKLYASAAKQEMDVEQSTYGLFYEWDEENGETDLAAGIAVIEGPDAPETPLITIGGKALKIEYWGGYAGSYDAHMAMYNYMEAMETESDLVVEMYHTNPMTEPDSNKWHTDILYMIK